MRGFTGLLKMLALLIAVSTLSACSSGLRNRSKAGAHLALTGTATLAAGTCSGAISVSLVDGNEKFLTATTEFGAALTTSGAGSFFSDSSCASVISSLTILKGAQSNQFYFKSTKAETLLLTAGESTGVAAGTFTLTVSYGEGASLQFSTQPPATASATVAFSTQPVVTILDGNGDCLF